MFSILAVVAVCLGTVTFSSHLASASTLGTDRARANQLLKQINRISAKVDFLGQKYDLAKIKLDRIANEIRDTKADVAIIKKHETKGDAQLRAEAVFAYVTNGAAASNNPLFSSSASKIGATNVYNQLAQGNVAETLSNLKNYKIELTQERSILASEVGRAASLTRAAARSFHSANEYQSIAQSRARPGEGQYRDLHRPSRGGRVGPRGDAVQQSESLATASPIRHRTRGRTSRSERP